MYVVIAGAGKFGKALAGWLISAGFEITVVDFKDEKCLAIDNMYGDVSVMGDSTDASVLIEAGIQRADLFVATTGSDDVNLVACQLSKHHFNVPKSIAIAHNREHVELFHVAGIDFTIDLTESVLSIFQEEMAHPGFAWLTNIDDNKNRFLVKTKVMFGSDADNQRLGDLALPNSTTMSLVVFRDGRVLVPDEDTVIHVGDEVIAVTSASDQTEFVGLFSPHLEE